VALALDAGLVKEAASKLEEYVQIKTSSSPASLETLNPAQLEAAARMYALEVHSNLLEPAPLHTSCAQFGMAADSWKQLQAAQTSLSLRQVATAMEEAMLCAGHTCACWRKEDGAMVTHLLHAPETP
jgi:hypothetical protein